MIGARHLADDRLFECYTSERMDEPVDPRFAEHLADCAACAARYAALVGMMEELAVQADAEIEAVFPAERLRTQQQQIARKIEHVGRHARVITFPGTSAADRMMPPAAPAHARSRWMAAAAAAGLFIGVALGVGFEWERQVRPSSSSVAEARPAAPAHLATVPVGTDGSTAAPAVAPDDSFLSDLDVALDRPQFAGELQVFDVLTPHVREIRYVR